MNNAMHLNEDELVLHYYGEMSAGDDARAAAHVRKCSACHASYTKLQRVLAAVEAAPGPEMADGFERTVWARLEPELGRQRRGWISWFVVVSARLAWAPRDRGPGRRRVLRGARCSSADPSRGGHQGRRPQPPPQSAKGLLVDLSDHLDRSQMMLVELGARAAMAGPTSVGCARGARSSCPTTDCIGRQGGHGNIGARRPCSTSSSGSWWSFPQARALSADDLERSAAAGRKPGIALQGARAVVGDSRRRRPGFGADGQELLASLQISRDEKTGQVAGRRGNRISNMTISNRVAAALVAER